VYMPCCGQELAGIGKWQELGMARVLMMNGTPTRDGINTQASACQQRPEVWGRGQIQPRNMEQYQQAPQGVPACVRE
jgi:hypothetical protein